MADVIPDDVEETEETTPSGPRWWAWALPSLALAGGLSALELVRTRFQRSRVFLRKHLPGGLSEEPTVLPIEDVYFSTEDGVRLHGWWVPHPRPRATWIYFHGSAGHLGHQSSMLELLYSLGVHIFAFDYRGYGRSEGAPSEAGLRRDARAAWRHVVEERGQDPERLLLHGQSLGGAVAVDAALRHDAAGLVIQSSFLDVRSMAAVRHPQISWIARNQFESIEKVERLEMPKLFVHGTADETVPVDHGRSLYERAAPPKTLFLVPGAGHNDVHLHAERPYRTKLDRFLRRCLGDS